MSRSARNIGTESGANPIPPAKGELERQMAFRGLARELSKSLYLNDLLISSAGLAYKITRICLYFPGVEGAQPRSAWPDIPRCHELANSGDAEAQYNVGLVKWIRWFGQTCLLVGAGSGFDTPLALGRGGSRVWHTKTGSRAVRDSGPEGLGFS